MFLLCSLSVSNQGRTKDEARNNLRTPKRKKVLLLRLPFFSPLLYLAWFYRENSERRPKEDLMTKKALFLRLSPKKVDLIPEKVVSLPKIVDSHPKSVALYSSPLHLTLYTLHQKNHTKMRFFLHIRKFCCTFADVISPRLGIMLSCPEISRH